MDRWVVPPRAGREGGAKELCPSCHLPPPSPLLGAASSVRPPATTWSVSIAKAKQVESKLLYGERRRRRRRKLTKPRHCPTSVAGVSGDQEPGRRAKGSWRQTVFMERASPPNPDRPLVHQPFCSIILSLKMKITIVKLIQGKRKTEE